MINFKINDKELFGRNIFLDIVLIVIYAVLVCPLLISLVVLSPFVVLITTLLNFTFLNNKYKKENV